MRHADPRHRAVPQQHKGVSLVELMVAMALSLIVLGGVLAIFASSRSTYETTDRLSRIQESGRFALDSIVRDLRAAGYIGCSRRAELTNVLNAAPGTLMWNFGVGVQGFNAQGTSWLPALDTGADTGASGAAAGSDVLVVRAPRGDFEPVPVIDRMNDTTDDVVVADVTPPLLEAGDIVQISDCNARAVFQITAIAAGVISHGETAGAGGLPGNSSSDIGYAFTDVAELVPLRSVVYYLRTGSTPGGGTSLWRRVSGGIPEELVEGVENMQIQYGERVGSNLTYRRADQVGNWANVVTVQIALLVRSMSEYGTDVGPQSYDLLGVSVANPGDRHMRQVFTTTVNIRNAAG
jgi:type IV pilus assembly protein PilW